MHTHFTKTTGFQPGENNDMTFPEYLLTFFFFFLFCFVCLFVVSFFFFFFFFFLFVCLLFSFLFLFCFFFYILTVPEVPKILLCFFFIKKRKERSGIKMH